MTCWLDSSNCYMKYYNKFSPEPLKGPGIFENITEVDVDNILHSKNCDTLIVLVGYVADWSIAGKTGPYSFFQCMKVVIDSSWKWHFNCSYDGPWYEVKGNKISVLARDFKKYLVKSDCLTDKNEIKSSFFEVAFTEGFYPHEKPKQ